MEQTKMSVERYTPTAEDRAGLRVNPEALKLSGDKTFYTIQGEGDSIGKPAVFMRLHLCNLQCGKLGGWKCDTPYTWDRDREDFWKEPEDWDFQRIVDNVSQFPAKRLVITGGEPLIQQKQIVKLREHIPDYAIEIETNGTIKPQEELSDCQFNCSPKLANSGNLLAARYKPDVLRHINGLEKSYFKFVVEKPEDFAEIDQMVAECELDPAKIIIMPEGITQDAIHDHALAVMDAVKERGWRLIPRLQVMLYGNTRRT